MNAGHHTTPVPVDRADLRVSDRDRERVVELLSHHAGEGRLDADELDGRIERALAARTRGELAGVTRDLPDVGGGGEARRRDRKSSPLAHQLAPFVAVNLVLIVVWAASGAGYFWPIWPMLGWGLGLVKGYAWGHHRMHAYPGRAR